MATIFAFFTQIQILLSFVVTSVFFYQFGGILGNFIFQLADIHRIRSSSAGSHIVDLIAAIIQALFCQRKPGDGFSA